MSVPTERPTGAIAAAELLQRLAHTYPDARCALDHANAFQLLVATVLSAQTTDAKVNSVTPHLFARFPDAAALAAAETAELEAILHPLGFFRAKALALKELAARLVDAFGGQVPATLEELTTLRGVGRKTANVVLGDAFGVPGITVDTHVRRLSRRMGLTTERDPERIERDLMTVVPHAAWTMFSHQMIAHGRTVCTARKPACDRCPLADICPRHEDGGA